MRHTFSLLSISFFMMLQRNVVKVNEVQFLIFINFISFLEKIQSGALCCAKHGGAYFSAVRGSIKDPIAVPGGHEVTGV